MIDTATTPVKATIFRRLMNNETPNELECTCDGCGNRFHKLYFEVVPPATGLCEGCATRASEAKYAAERREERKKSWCDICPPLYRQTDLARLPIDDETVRRVLGWQCGPRGMLLTGPSGTGKTRLIYKMLEAQHLAGKSIKVFDCTQFAHEAVQAAKSDSGVGYWAKNIVRQSIVFFDDLGKSKLTDHVESELFGIVEARTAQCRPVIATTNDTGASLEARMSDDRGQPFIRRLREFCESIPVVPKTNKGNGYG